MLVQKIFGLPLAAISFLVVSHSTAQYWGAGIPLLLGGTVAGAIWFFFTTIDKRRQEKLLHPEPQTWNVPLPIAWGMLREIFGGQPMRTDKGDLVYWQITHEDQSSGKLSAVCTLDDGSRIAVFIRLSNDSRATAIRRDYETNADWHMVKDMISGIENQFPLEFGYRQAD